MNPNDPQYQDTASQTPPQPAGQDYVKTQNNYDFILNPNHAIPQKSFGGNKALKLLVLVAAGVTVLIVALFIAISLLRPKPPTAGLLGIIQRQEEIVRLAKQGETQAESEDLKGLAYTIDLSISTNQDKTKQYTTDMGTKILPAELKLKREKATDTLLENAKTTSTYDSALRLVLEDQLTTYLKELQTSYKNASGKNLRTLLNENFVSGKTLLDNAKTDT